MSQYKVKSSTVETTLQYKPGLYREGKKGIQMIAHMLHVHVHQDSKQVFNLP